MSQDEFQALLQFMKVLADENRLKLLGILANGERSVEELAALLKLKAPTVSHHLAKLRELDLVGMRGEGNTHYYWLNGDALRQTNRLLLTPEKMASLVDDVEGDAWERKVLRDFFDGIHLKEIPASPKKRSVILKWLVNQFEYGVYYKEKQVNEIIQRHHEDSAFFRRELAAQNWKDESGGATLNGSDVKLNFSSPDQNAQLRLVRAHADELALVVRTCATCGRVAIYRGGVLWRTISTHRATTRSRVLVVLPRFSLRTTSIWLQVVGPKKVFIDGIGVRPV